FIRTKLRPLLVRWNPEGSDQGELRRAVDESLETYRAEYAEYYRAHARPDSPAMRDSSPSVVLIPGLGMFSFGKSKSEARITGEFWVNTIHAMEGATALGNRTRARVPDRLPSPGSEFPAHHNYVALPPSEAFQIEYWPLEEAKIRRQPPESEFSRKVVVV